jgi:hypothetical protein
MLIRLRWIRYLEIEAAICIDRINTSKLQIDQIDCR